LVSTQLDSYFCIIEVRVRPEGYAFLTKELFETKVGVWIEVFANHVGMERMDVDVT
jgi:hypothetical protein